jgi:predicted N-formylglutamate amidohydrolase
MGHNQPNTLLGPDDPAPVRIVNPGGSGPFLLLGDHAGNAVPRLLSDLGLPRHELDRHIAFDLGIASLGQRLSHALGATFISQAYSRLVVDCNREPTHREAIPDFSDWTRIPGNINLSNHNINARISEIHKPYHTNISNELAIRDHNGQESYLISLHSFTPYLGGLDRPWSIGVLHDGRNDTFARHVMAALNKIPGLVVGDNKPYTMDSTDFTVPRHAFESERPYVEIEIRQDLLKDSTNRWAEILSTTLKIAYEAANS